jgi:hypothetical protein
VVGGRLGTVALRLARSGNSVAGAKSGGDGSSWWLFGLEEEEGERWVDWARRLNGHEVCCENKRELGKEKMFCELKL